MVEISSLRRHAFFGGLEAEQIEKLLPLMEYETYRAGDVIIEEGSRNDKIRFILEGRAAAVKERLILFEFGEGDAFGEMEVLDVMPSAASIRAEAPTEVMSLSNKALHSVYKSDINTFAMLVMNLARELSRRLRQMDERVVKESPFVEWG